MGRKRVLRDAANDPAAKHPALRFQGMQKPARWDCGVLVAVALGIGLITGFFLRGVLRVILRI